MGPLAVPPGRSSGATQQVLPLLVGPYEAQPRCSTEIDMEPPATALPSPASLRAPTHPQGHGEVAIDVAYIAEVNTQQDIGQTIHMVTWVVNLHP